jgi:ferritin-like metal-binding protein YciE
MASTIQGQVARYLRDAYAMEHQSLTTLEAAEKITGDVDLEQTIRGHVTETKQHITHVGTRLEQLGETPSKLKNLAGKVGAVALGAGIVVQRDRPGKLLAVAYAYEHFEIAAYELLRRVAEKAGDTATVEVADRILAQERSAAEKLSWSFDAAVEASLEKTGATS